MTHRFITVNSQLPEDMDALVRQAGWNYIH